MNPDQNEIKMKQAKRFGEGLLLILVAVNLVEFWLALVVKFQPLLAVAMMFLALVDVVFILWYFMHLPRLLKRQRGQTQAKLDFEFAPAGAVLLRQPRGGDAQFVQRINLT